MADYLGRVAPALRAAGIDGWLFYNVYHRDHVADTILGVPAAAMNTRPWAALVRADGSLTRIVHAIEAGVLGHLPGPVAIYASRAEFVDRLRAACPRRTPVAVNYSATIPALSLVDHGTVALLQQLAIPALSAEPLIQRVLGVLGAAGRASHDRAAALVRGVLDDAWRRLADRLRGGEAASEGEVRDWISAAFERHGLITEEAPLVAAGAHSSGPRTTSRPAPAPRSRPARWCSSTCGARETGRRRGVRRHIVGSLYRGGGAGAGSGHLRRAVRRPATAPWR